MLQIEYNRDVDKPTFPANSVNYLLYIACIEQRALSLFYFLNSMQSVTKFTSLDSMKRKPTTTTFLKTVFIPRLRETANDVISSHGDALLGSLPAYSNAIYN